MTATVCGPHFAPMEASYGILPDGTAVIEMAACAGLPLVENRKNPMLATTYGVGILIKDAISRGVEEIILGLGGSATNDGGMGYATARLLSQNGYTVYALDMRVGKAEENIIPIEADLTSEKSVNSAFQKIKKKVIDETNTLC